MLSHEDFMKVAGEKVPEIEVTGRFQSRKERIDVRCRNCGRSWSPLAESLLAGHGCPACNGSGHISEEDFLTKLKVKRDDVVLVGKYEKALKKTYFRFLSCGHVCEMAPSKILSGRNCPKCSDARRGASQRLALADFEKVMRETDPNLSLGKGAEYRNQDTPVALHCYSCGKDFTMAFKSMRKSNGCPFCHARNTSFMEKFLLHAFVHALGEDKVLPRDKATIGLELDILISDLHIAVEPGSWYYHEGHLGRDLEKKELCSGKGIRLITIYDHFPEGKTAPFADCYVYTCDLSSKRRRSLLKSVVITLFDEAGLPCDFSDADWKAIERRAQVDARRMTTEEFRRELEGLNPNIEFVDTYDRANDNKRFRCLVCGHEWHAAPTSIRMGYGCPKCAGKIKLTEEKFAERLKACNPDITIAVPGSYVNTGRTILFRCGICHHEWSTQPYHLIASDVKQRTGCPACSGKKRRSHEEFVSEMARINPRIRIIGRYQSRHKEVEVRCRDCGNTWLIRPSDLLKGKGCSTCRNKAAGERRKRKVQCLDTGEVFPGVVDAAREYKVHSASIVNCCNGKNQLAAEKRWRYCNADE